MNKEVLVFICHNCIPPGAQLEWQWSKESVHVEIRKLPCSGKVSVEYLFHALEGGKDAIGIITCPPGECTLFQGNYRAHIRTETVRHLLEEIGLPASAIKLMHFSKEKSAEELDRLIGGYVDEVAQLRPETVLKQTG